MLLLPLILGFSWQLDRSCQALLQCWHYECNNTVSSIQAAHTAFNYVKENFLCGFFANVSTFSLRNENTSTCTKNISESSKKIMNLCSVLCVSDRIEFYYTSTISPKSKFNVCLSQTKLTLQWLFGAEVASNLVENDMTIVYFYIFSSRYGGIVIQWIELMWYHWRNGGSRYGLM